MQWAQDPEQGTHAHQGKATDAGPACAESRQRPPAVRWYSLHLPGGYRGKATDAGPACAES
eukprot:5228899-Heterocapsa_arctica.AAC.1